MEKKVTDFSPYLQNGEKLLAKQRSVKGNGAFVELAVCFLLWLLCVAGDCFFIGAMTKIRETTKVSETYLFVLIPCIVIHIVPFAAWMVNILKKLSPLDEKWYAVTDRRIAIVTGVKPVSVTFLNLSDVTAISLGEKKIVANYGEEKLALTGLVDADLLYDVLEKAIFPDDKTGSDAEPNEVENGDENEVGSEEKDV